MVGLVDIAPVTAKVTIRGNEYTVHGVTVKALAQLLARFPALRAVVTGRSAEMEDIIRLGGDVVAALIAAGMGKPGDPAEEAAVDNLTLEEQADVLVAVIKLTMPNGVGPLVEKLSGLMGDNGKDIAMLAKS